MNERGKILKTSISNNRKLEIPAANLVEKNGVEPPFRFISVLQVQRCPGHRRRHRSHKMSTATSDVDETGRASAWWVMVTQQGKLQALVYDIRRKVPESDARSVSARLSLAS